ncbi:neuropeptide Y receptor type 2-like isoform X2 [Planococcus citri]|uniref:neuropeptide Y receptor type 2-like isoform X2 n=1 Tax=Planococcus citri TaxID=170843 RepID=UPI0031F72ECA
MITTTRLHRHESNLLPPADTGQIVSAVMGYLENTTMSKEELTAEFDKPSPQDVKLSKLFNFSLPDAFEIIMEHKRKLDQVFVQPVEISLIVIYAGLMSWGIIANVLLCFIVVRQCMRKNMTNNGPSPRNLYIVNLAIADMLLCMICMPFTLFSLLKRRWTLGILLCKMVPIVQGTNIMVSSGTITAIAFDRYFTIVRSPRDAMCRCSVSTTLILIWITSFLCVLPLVFFQQIEAVALGEFVLYEVCLEKWPSSEMQKSYTITLAVAQFIIPLVVLTAVHMKISVYLNVHLNEPSRNSFSSREVRRNRRTMWILSCIAIVFALSWLPLTTFTVILEFGIYTFKTPTSMYMTFVVCHMVAMTTAGTNPLLYGYMNTNFRRDLLNLYYSVFKIDGNARRSQRRRRLNSQIYEGRQHRDGKSANTTTAEPVSIIVKNRDRRTSSSVGTTLTTTFRTRSSSCGIAQQKIDEL